MLIKTCVWVLLRPSFETEFEVLPCILVEEEKYTGSTGKSQTLLSILIRLIRKKN